MRSGQVEVFVTLGRHPHLAALLGVTTHPDGATCMLVEYAPRGSLGTLLSHLAEKNAPPSEAVNPKPYTRNPKPQTRNPKPETRNPKPEIRNLKPETRNPKPATRNPKPESRNPTPSTLTIDAGADHDRAADLRCHGPARRARSPSPPTLDLTGVNRQSQLPWSRPSAFGGICRFYRILPLC